MRIRLQRMLRMIPLLFLLSGECSNLALISLLWGVGLRAANFKDCLQDKLDQKQCQVWMPPSKPSAILYRRYLGFKFNVYSSYKEITSTHEHKNSISGAKNVHITTDIMSCICCNLCFFFLNTFYAIGFTIQIWISTSKSINNHIYWHYNTMGR